MVCFVKPQALIAAFLACSNRANKVARLGQTTNYNVLQIDNFACCMLHAACGLSVIYVLVRCHNESRAQNQLKDCVANITKRRETHTRHF